MIQLTKTSLIAALSLCILAAGTAHAQLGPRHEHSRPGGPSHAHLAPPRYQAPRPAPPQAQPQRPMPPHVRPSAHNQRPHHTQPRRFQSGQALPPTYRGRHHVVDNWRAHGLRRPPRGQQWMLVGGDYLLVNMASHVILSIFSR